MAKVDVYDIKGKKTSQTTLPKEMFDAKINKPLMVQAVKVYLGNQRKARAKTKTRGEIRGSTRKIYRQKGTGRARHADRYAPIFVGGGVAHGPTGKENYKRKMSKKMRRLALFSALTSKLKAKEIMVINGLVKVKPKTKEMAKSLFSPQKEKGKISIVLPEVLENVIRAGKNIPNLNFIQAKQLNTYQVLNAGQLIFMKESIIVLKEVFLK